MDFERVRTRSIGSTRPSINSRMGFIFNALPSKRVAPPIRPPRCKNSSVSTANTRPVFSLEVDPFQKRPNIDILISNQAGKPVANASIIETMTKKMEITMHLRGAPAPGQYHVRAELYYQQKSDPPEANPPIITQVDLAETIFMIETDTPEADNSPG
jgi:hypothetical protein